MNFGTEKLALRERVLSLLSDLGWHSFSQIHSVGGIRYSARLLELKRLGYRIEDRATGTDGKDYRLISLTPGPAQEKRVKVFLRETDAEKLVVGKITRAAIAAVSDALGSFKTNRDNL